MIQRSASNNPKERRCDMAIIARTGECKKCGAEVRSDWKSYSNRADKINYSGEYEACAE